MITKRHIAHEVIVKPTDPIRPCEGFRFFVIDVCIYKGIESALGYFINDNGRDSVEVYLNQELWELVE